MAACDAPRHFPLGCPSREYLARGLRVAFAGGYAIYYQHDDRHFIVIRVVHGARDVEAFADRGGFKQK
jgi:toxin ParE1/3/4